MGVSSAPPTGGGLEPPIPLTDLATQAAHTALANVTGSTAVPTAATMAALLADLKAQNTTVVTLGANADSIGITGLDGQTDGNYKITLDLTVVLTNARLFTFQPNSLATNQEYVGLNSAA